MRSMDSTMSTFGPISEEPYSYDRDDSSLTSRSRNSLHRLRRTTSLTCLDRAMSSMDGSGTLQQSPLVQYRQKSHSSYSLPRERIRRFSSLSGPVVLSGETASPALGEARLDDGQPPKSDSFDSDFSLVAVTPSHIVNKRYKRTHFHPDQHPGEPPKIKAFQTSFRPSTSELLVSGEYKWKPYVSPEGSLYFREETKNILTFVDLYNPEYRDGVSHCAQYLASRIMGQKPPPAEDTEIVIMLEDFDYCEDFVYGYYLASWEKRCIFWLEEVTYDFVTREADRISVLVMSRICMLLFNVINKRIRIHIEIFPCHRTAPEDVLDEIKHQLNQGIFDHISSNNSIFPWDRVDSAEMLRCIEKVKPSKPNAHDIWVVARCNQQLVEHTFLNYHGERGARIHREDSVLKPSVHGKRSWLFKILSPLLFTMPSVYLKELENVWIDDTVDWISWRRFILLLSKDWQQSITPATVILGANVGFLAIQSVDVESTHKTAAQIASYVSSALASFYFITVQILSHQHRYSDHYTTSKAGEFLERRSRQWLGLESVALTFSLPTALFIWSMLTFLGAMMVVFFWRTSLPTQIVMGSILATLFLATAVMLMLDWNSHSESPQKSILYTVCPSGLRSVVLKVKEKWQIHVGSSGASVYTASTGTAVGSGGH